VRERLRVEGETLRETLARSDHAWLVQASTDGLLYEVEFEVRTLFQDAARRIDERERVVCILYHLHEDHPHRSPIAVARETGLFNTHVADPRQGPSAPPIPLLCLSAFQAQHRLADWVVATWDVLRWQKVATDSAMNREAAEYALRALRDPDRFPIDRREFWREERA
jgi:hypothetical protein